jgi:hypothetical protein
MIVSRILGHTDLATTAEVSAHLTPAILDRARGSDGGHPGRLEGYNEGYRAPNSLSVIASEGPLRA